ncbi:MAG: ATP-dependent zinc protease [Nanoarchaeota archaeon]|nr:ATP-dependent zinc protease [Nanoarchaeota archaeon]
MSLDHKYDDRAVIGFLEWVHCKAKNGKDIVVKARIDSGATKSSIDQELVKTLGWGPVLGEKRIRNAHGFSTRHIVDGHIMLSGKDILEHFTIADRAHMRFPILIGRNVLRRGFLIDPNKKLPREEE